MNKKITNHGLFFLLTFFSNSLIAQNVGIGISNPLDKLHVVGNIRSSTLAGVGNRTVLTDPNGTLIVGTAANAPDWTILGNTGTNPAVNFIGTTDLVDWVVRTNNLEQIRVLSTGNVGIGIAAPLAKLHVQVAAGTAIRGTQTGFGSGYLGYSGAISLGTFGSPPGAVIYSEEGVATSNPSLIAVTRNPATYAASIAFSDVWIAGYFGVDNPSASFNPSGVYGQLNVTNNTLAGLQSAIKGYFNRGTITGNPGTSNGIIGIAKSQSQTGIGVMGISMTNATATVYSAGGYFEGDDYTPTGFYGYAYVGGNVGGANIKINGTGSVAEIVPTPDHGRVSLTCPESPEYWYQDYGTVDLVNGKAHVDLDPILTDIIFVNKENPIRAFCTPVDMPLFNGVTMTNRTEKGFDLVELNGGTHTGTLEYQLVVKPKTNYGAGRFMQAPGPIGLKPDKEPLKAKAKNQPDISKIWRWPSDNIVYDYVLPKQEPQKMNITPEKK